jgi:hypothetical protein
MIDLLLVFVLQEARDVLPSDRPVELRVPVSTDTQHRATVVTFPEESLEALVSGWNEGDLSIERRRENLFIKLLRKSQGDLQVLGASGALYRFAVVAAEGPYDGHVRILAPKEQKRSIPESVELIRAMRLGRRPSEGTVLRAEQRIPVAAELAANVIFVYESSAYRGFVIRIENVSSVAQRLDPSRFQSKDLVLAGAREMLVPPAEKTLLYLVFWKTP